MRRMTCLLLMLSFLLCACASQTAPEAPAAAIPAAQQTEGSQLGLSIGEEQPPKGDTGLADSDYAVLEDRILNLYVHTEGGVAQYAQSVNSLFGMFPEEIRCYAAAVPSRIQFESADVRAYADDQRADIEEAYHHLDARVTTVDMFSQLEAHSVPLDDVYYRLDHHWTALGAYYGASAFFAAAGMPYHALDEYTAHSGADFHGYLYSVAGQESHAARPDKLIYYTLPGQGKKALLQIPDENGTLTAVEGPVIDPARGGYYTFVGRMCAYGVLQGMPESKRALLLIGDSSIYALAPWLADNFGTVVLIDLTYYDMGYAGLAGLLDEYAVTDAMVCTFTYTAMMFPYYAGRIAELGR